MASSSSAHKQLHLHLPNPYRNTAAPPPTPSAAHNNNISSTTSDAPADVFSSLLHRLTPTLNLSLPTRRSSLTTTTVTPLLLNLSNPIDTLRSDIISAGSKHGFFQLTHHSIPSQLAQSAESDASSIFNLPRREKQLYFPENWPLGYDVDDEEHDDGDDDDAEDESSFCLDPSCSVESTGLSLTSLREFNAQMEKLGREIVEVLTGAYGVNNPARNDTTQLCSLMWLSQGSGNNARPEMPGRMYPYVVSLQYQMRSQKYSVLTDSGPVAVSPEVDAVLVTFGDIAQVWSNGKVKKVRGRPIATAQPNLDATGEKLISMTMLITLPIHSIVSPLLPNDVVAGDDDHQEGDDHGPWEFLQKREDIQLLLL